MYCPSCGKETPENSKFCLHCGTQLSSLDVTAPPPIVTEWEYQDFVYEGWQPGETWVSTSGRNSYTVPGARLHFWQGRQQMILAELRKWLDQGWEPVGEVGPGGIALHQYKAIKREPFGWMLAMFFYVGTFGLFLLFDLMTMDWWAEPTEFRVKMRRRRTPTRQESALQSDDTKSQPSVLRIRRTYEETGSVVSFAVLVDKSEVGVLEGYSTLLGFVPGFLRRHLLGEDKKREFEVQPGRHSIHIEEKRGPIDRGIGFDPRRSETITVDFRPGETVAMTCTHRLTGSFSRALPYLRIDPAAELPV